MGLSFYKLQSTKRYKIHELSLKIKKSLCTIFFIFFFYMISKYTGHFVEVIERGAVLDEVVDASDESSAESEVFPMLGK